MAGLAVGEAPVTKQAAVRGLGPLSVEDVEMAGVGWREVAPADYVLPQRDLSSRLSPALAERAKGLVTAKPVLAQPDRCTSCRTCADNCPAEAITMVDGKPTFDYGECIRCYCCQELCPPQVIALKRNWLVRALVG
jgi:ferredoxin